MSDFRRLPPAPESRVAPDWRGRVAHVLVWVIAALLTVGLLIAAFFIGLVVLGLMVVVGLIVWVRGKLRGDAPRPGRFRRQGRTPVIIEGEFVVLSGQAVPRSGTEPAPRD